jgi:multicomponent Na+:H+ antiporter subunit E
VVITYLLPLPPFRSRALPIALARLAILVSWYLLWSSFQVAYPSSPAAADRGAEDPLNIKSDLVLALAVNIINLIPGRSCWRSTRCAG